MHGQCLCRKILYVYDYTLVITLWKHLYDAKIFTTSLLEITFPQTVKATWAEQTNRLLFYEKTTAPAANTMASNSDTTAISSTRTVTSTVTSTITSKYQLQCTASPHRENTAPLITQPPICIESSSLTGKFKTASNRLIYIHRVMVRVLSLCLYTRLN